MIYRDGWRIGQQDWHRSSPCLFSTVTTKFHLDRKFVPGTNLVSKSWCFGVFAYISARSSREKKMLEFFIYVFSPHNQWGVRVSASIFLYPNLEWFTRYDCRKLKLSTFYGWPSSYVLDSHSCSSFIITALVICIRTYDVYTKLDRPGFYQYVVVFILVWVHRQHVSLLTCKSISTNQVCLWTRPLLILIWTRVLCISCLYVYTSSMYENVTININGKYYWYESLCGTY